MYKMILKIYRISSCKYVCNKCDYKITEKIDIENTNTCNKIKPNAEEFVENDQIIEEQNILKEMQEKLEYYGETPDENDLRNFYDYAYENLIKNKISKYDSEINTFIKQSYENVIHYKEGEPKENGEYDRDQYMSCWYFEINKTDTIYLVHHFANDEGCGCFNNSYPLAVFDDKEEANNFLKKCNDAAKNVSGVYYYLDEYTITDNTFVRQ